MGKRRVFLYGSSLFMAGVKASLQLCPELDITTVEQSSPHTGEPVIEGRPDAVLFDLTDGQPEFVLDLVKQYPAVVLIGVDFTHHQAIVLSGQKHPVFSMQDLVQAMDVVSGSSPPPDGWQARCERLWQPFSKWVARLGGMTIGRKTTNDSPHILSKQAPFIAREEPKMKNLNQRTRIILAIAAILVLIVVVGSVIYVTNEDVRNNIASLSGGGELSGAAVTATYNGNSLVDVCYRATNGAPMHLWYDNGWKQESLDGTPKYGLACSSWGPRELDMFGVGQNDHVLHRSWDGTRWSVWGDLGTLSSSVTPAGTPAVATRGPGQVEVFVRGSDNAIWHREYTDRTPNNGIRDGTWGTWSRFDISTNDDVAAISTRAGGIDVFVRGTNNKLYHAWWNDGSWHGWETWDDTANMATAPTVGSRLPNTLEVYWKNSSGQVIKKMFGPSWGAAAVNGTFPERPSLTSIGANRFDYFWKDGSNNLHRRVWDAATGISADENLGVTVGSVPSVASSRRSLEWQFDAVPASGGKPLAFVFSKDASGNFIGDDATLTQHYQGIQRKDYNGTPYLFVTRGGGDTIGELLVVKMGSKVGFTGPLGTNRTDSTGDPDNLDVTVRSYHFNGQNSWPNCKHPGSGQVVGNVLVLPIEQCLDLSGMPTGGLILGRSRGIVLLDVTNPENITLKKVIYTYKKNGTDTEFPDDMSSVVGAVQQSTAFNSKILFAFTSYPYDGGKALRFLESDSSTLDANTTLTFLSMWNRDDLRNDVDCGTVIKCGRFRCGRDCAGFTLNWQTINFVSKDNSLYLIGTDSDAEVAGGGESAGHDYARLFHIARSGNTFTLTYKDDKHVDSGNPVEMGNWNAASGVYQSPAGQLMIYMTGHDNLGPSVDGRQSIHAGEFSPFNGVQW